MGIKRIVVQSSAGPYSVVCGAGVLRHAAKEIAKLGKFSSVHIVSSAKVWRALGKSARRGCEIANPRCVHLMNDGESAKNLRTVEWLARDLDGPQILCRSEEHTSELQSRQYLVCRLLLE